MQTWDARQYLRFEAERTRPVRDLLAQVPLDSPRGVIDLGCGPGNSTEVLRQRFPESSILGIDNSEAMLETARRTFPQMHWEAGDIASFRAEPEADLLFSNAALQWLPNHRALFPRLVEQLPAGGCLAVQMPRNYEEPVHRLMRQVAAEARWSDRLTGRRALTPVETPAFYYDLLKPRVSALNLWQTTYFHVLPNADAVVEWMRGSGLRPYLEALPATEAAEFEAAYRAAIAQAYPAQEDGSVLLPFPRLFMVAQK